MKNFKKLTLTLMLVLCIGYADQSILSAPIANSTHSDTAASFNADHAFQLRGSSPWSSPEYIRSLKYPS